MSSAAIRIIGEPLLARDDHGELKSRIATVFPYRGVVVTLPGIHATQRLAFVDILNQERAALGMDMLSEAEQMAEWEKSVDLIMQGDNILIRPDPADMTLAFKADEMLQEIVSKHNIHFLHVLNCGVRDAIKERGECWRISPLPKSPEQMREMVRASRIGIGGRPIYYYNNAIGIRYLTYDEFARLGRLDDDELRRYLIEIQQHAARCNRLGHPEIDFFMAGGCFTAADFAGYALATMEGARLRGAYESLRQKFAACVPADYRTDDLESLDWKNHMFAALIGQSDEVVSEESLLGLSTEFFMQVEWLPGARIEAGELIFDPIFEEKAQHPDDPELQRLCDDKARGFIFDFIREYGDLEYVNIGRVIGSLSLRKPTLGRRDVYVAELKLKSSDQDILRIIRMQKRGVREYLDEGRGLLEAITESERYTDYILDRRLGCRQLGMNMPLRVFARRLRERYAGDQKRYEGVEIWSPYFERDYIYGMATDKMPCSRLVDQAFAERFATLLGRAAATNLIVGRADPDGKLIFDDGDEVMIEDPSGMPIEMLVADHTGAFVDYETDLRLLAPLYAGPISKRIDHVTRPEQFVEAYISAFSERFAWIQQEYRRRQRAFDNLFRHPHRDESPGSFLCRWRHVLARLNAADPGELAELVRASVRVTTIAGV